ncbi:MAG: YesL family protein [Clostridia bacterium]|nr:YesL family protein [Clostridia bacterium]
MGLFTPSFDKPGKGVDENAPQKRSFFRFFEILSRKFTHFIRVSLIYSVFLIPTFIIVFLLMGLITNNILSMPGLQELMHSIAEQIAEAADDANLAELTYNQMVVGIDMFGRLILSFLFTTLWGMGPATAGVTYVLRNFAREEHAWVWADFLDAAKSNFKQSVAVFVIDIVAFFVFYMAIMVYSQMPGIMGAMRYVIWMIIFVFTMMHLYIYPMMVTFKLTIKELYRNALIFALGKLPSNVFIIAILLLIQLGPAYLALQYGGNYYVLLLIIAIILELVIFLSLSSFLVNFNAYPKMKKYMMENNDEEVKTDIFENEDE